MATSVASNMCAALPNSSNKPDSSTEDNSNVGAAAPTAPVIATTQSYKGFGSFMSDNVQDLIQLPKDKYQAPHVPEFARSILTPAQQQQLSSSSSSSSTTSSPPVISAPLGNETMRKYFRMSPDWTFINHGAFGGALTGGVNIKREYEDMMETQPLTFVDRTLLPLLVHSARSIADFINAVPADVSLVPNATFGLNAAIFGLIESSDVVAYLDTEYGSVWRMLLERCQRVGANLNEIPLNRHFHNKELFGNDEALTKYIKESLPAGCTTVVLDHIASNGAFELPIFTHLVPMLKSVGVKNIIVDGAHGPLQCPLDFASLPKECRPSVYVGNLHKWFSCPKSVGFIWAHDGKVKNKIRSPIVSHGFNSGYFSEFVWNGTTDYGAHLAVPAVANFWKDTVGVEKARSYCSNLLKEASEMLEKRFGGEVMARKAPFMALVQLPAYLNNPKKFSSKYLQDTLHYRFNVEVPVKNIENKLYFRLSAFVYNNLADYVRLAQVTEQLARQHQNGDLDNPEGEASASLSGEGKKKKPSVSKRNRDDEEEEEGNIDAGGCGSPSNKNPSGVLSNMGGCGCGVGGLGASTKQVKFDEDSSDDES